jgi:hypothetical protein
MLGVIALEPTGLIAAGAFWLTYGPLDLDALYLALFVGCLAGIIGGLGGGVGVGIAQRLDWWVARLPPQRLGVVGVAMIVIGFALQSVQYWFAALNILLP